MEILGYQDNSLTAAAPLAEAAKTVNLKFNALAAAASIVDVGADFRLTKRFTFGPEFWYSQSHIGFVDTGYAALARGNFMITGQSFESGMYVSAYAGYAAATISSYQIWNTDGTLLNGNASAGNSGTLMGAMVGYQWVWNTGFNFNVGAGYAMSSFDVVNLNGADGNTAASLTGNTTGGGLLGGFKAEISVGFIL